VNEQARTEWAQVRGRFGALLQNRHEGDALEELGWAGWFLGDARLALRARERAFRFYRQTSDAAGAGRAATWLAVDSYEFRGDALAAHTWLDRAHSALDGLPESADHAWLMLAHAELVHRADRDLSTVLALARSASNLGRAFQVADIEAIGLGLEGLALAGVGTVADSWPALDAAAAIVATEPMSLPFTTAWTLDCGVRALEGTGDLARLGRWCEAARLAARRSGLRHLLGRARTAHGRLLMLAGDWPGAERELVNAVRDLRSVRPGLAAPAHALLGELRAYQGREQEARGLLERAGVDGLVGSARLALAADDTGAAIEFAERFLRHLPNEAVVDRLPALELLARARLRAGDLISAELDVAAVEVVAAACGTPFATGVARLLMAELGACRRDPHTAREAAEQALDAFETAHVPYHAAQARVARATALASYGRIGHAERERAAALNTLEVLGAVGDVERLRRPPPLALAGLTTRETQILRMIADGRSDADVAQHLAISPSTVQRNLVSLRAKLRLPSRAAATAYAARAGLT
jgi:DNA-binding CsgD family transcriptional regulator/tetratricopeptide (TPR) repeat protein